MQYRYCTVLPSILPRHVVFEPPHALELRGPPKFLDNSRGPCLLDAMTSMKPASRGVSGDLLYYSVAPEFRHDDYLPAPCAKCDLAHQLFVVGENLGKRRF